MICFHFIFQISMNALTAVTIVTLMQGVQTPLVVLPVAAMQGTLVME